LQAKTECNQNQTTACLRVMLSKCAPKLVHQWTNPKVKVAHCQHAGNLETSTTSFHTLSFVETKRSKKKINFWSAF